MFEAGAMLFIYVETPLHAGSGRGLGVVDLPIQRERTTDYPMIQASGLKGCLRAVTAPGRTGDPDQEGRRTLSAPEHTLIFGPETNNASDHAGALMAGDARLLLFPVRSLAGVVAWTTSADALARFQREAAVTGVHIDWNPGEGPPADTAWVNGDTLLAGDAVVLEEFSYTPDRAQAGTVAAIGGWLAANALPASGEYDYWRDALPKKLCILPDVDFRDFTQHSTDVQTHVKLDPATKTVVGGALWTSESLPVDTLLYAPLLASRSRGRNGTNLAATEVLQRLIELDLRRIQLGGDETTGQGIVALRFAPAARGGGA